MILNFTIFEIPFNDEHISWWTQFNITGGKDAACSFRSIRTNTYKLHFFETASGIRFALNTQPDAPDLIHILQHIYSSIFIKYVIMNDVYINM